MTVQVQHAYAGFLRGRSYQDVWKGHAVRQRPAGYNAAGRYW